MKCVAFLMTFLVGGCAGCLKKLETRPAAPAPASQPAVAASAPAPASDATHHIRRAQMAGSWYSENKDQLAAEVDGLFAEAKPPKIDGKIIALISPHAGYRFSGKAAAANYLLLRGQDVRRVVLLAISHHYTLNGAATYCLVGAACLLAGMRLKETNLIAGRLRDRLEEGILQRVAETKVNGCPATPPAQYFERKFRGGGRPVACDESRSCRDCRFHGFCLSSRYE